MKKIIVAFLIATGLLLTGCSGKISVSSLTPEQQVVADVRADAEDQGVSMSSDDKKILVVAHEVCGSLDRGESIDSVLTALALAAGEPGKAHVVGVLLGSSIKNLCPSHMDEAKDYLDGVALGA